MDIELPCHMAAKVSLFTHLFAQLLHRPAQVYRTYFNNKRHSSCTYFMSFCSLIAFHVKICLPKMGASSMRARTASCKRFVLS